MRRLAGLIALLASSLIAASLIGWATPAAADSACRNVSLRANSQVLTATRGLKARHVGCATARKVARGWLSGAEGLDVPHPLGFTCRPSSDGARVTCARGAKRVWWRYASAGSSSAASAARVEAVRRASGKTRAAMVRAATRFARSNSNYKSFHVARAVISTVNRRWGAVRLVPPDDNSATVILKHSHGRWTATDLGTSFECAAAPRGVLEDLLGSCM